MGILAESLRASGAIPAEPVGTTISGGPAEEFGKGLRSGLTGMGAGLTALGGQAAGAMGFDETAESLRTSALRQQAEAQAQAPRVTSYQDVGSLRDAVHYGAGILGGSAPSLAVGLGAGIASGGSIPAALALGTAAQTLPESGDVALKQLNDGSTAPAGEQLVRSLVGGAGSAALQTIVPGAVGAKIVGRGAAQTAKQSVKGIVGRNLAAIPGEGLTEAGGTLVKQGAAGGGFDEQELKESFVGGMVGGAPLSAVGTGADLMHAAPRKAGAAVKEAVAPAVEATTDAASTAWDSVKDAAAWTADKIPEPVRQRMADLGTDAGERFASAKARYDAILAADDVPAEIKAQVVEAGKALGSFAKQAYVFGVDAAREGAKKARPVAGAAADKFGELTAKLRGKTEDDTAERIVAGQPPGVDLAEMASAPPERAAGLLKRSTEHAAKYASDAIGKVGQRFLTAEQRQTLADIGSNVGDAANTARLAAVDVASKAYEVTQRKVRALASGFAKTTAEPAGAKKSEVYDGFDELVRERITPVIADKHPAMLEDAETLQLLATGIRKYTQAAAENDLPRIRALDSKLRELLGEDTDTILEELHGFAAEQNPDKVATFFRAINEGKRASQSRDGLIETIRQATSAEAPGRTGVDASIEDWADGLVSWARGEMDTGVKERDDLRRSSIMELLQKQFGTKAKTVLKAVEDYIEADNVREEAKANTLDSDERMGDQTEFGDTEEKDVESSYYSKSGAAPTLYEDAASHRTNNPDYAYEPPVEQQLKKLRDANPDKKVSFVKLRDYAKARGWNDKQLTEFADGKDPSTHGMIKMEAIRADDGLKPHEIRAMRGAVKSKNHPNAIEVPGTSVVYDSRRIAHAMGIEERAGTAEFENSDDPIAKTHGFRGALASKFAEGIAKLTVHHGAVPLLRDDHVVAVIDQTPFTWGEAKTLLATPKTVREAPGFEKASLPERKLVEFLPELSDTDLRTLQQRALRGMDAADEEVAAAANRMFDAIQFEADKRAQNTRRDQLLDTDNSLRTEGDAEGQIHDAAATVGAKDLARNNPALGARAPIGQNLITKVDMQLRRVKSPMVDRLRSRFTKLAQAMGAMTGDEQRTVQWASDRIMENNLTAAMEALTPLARKYQDRIVPPSQPAAEPGIGAARDLQANEGAQPAGAGLPRTPSAGGPAKELAAPVEDLWSQVFGDADRTGDQPRRSAGGPTDPKAVAAKKAAFLERAASGDQGLIEELGASTDAKGLQRGLVALNGVPATPGTRATARAIYDRLNALVEADPELGYKLQLPKYSLDATQAAGSTITSKGRKQVLDAIYRLLGNSVQVDFAPLMHAGEFTKRGAIDVIRISVTALDPTGVAYHESLHAFFKQLKDKGLPEVRETLARAANTPKVVAKLRELLAHSPEALKQLDNAEERAAYMFQFWSLGQLEITGQPQTLFQKIKDGILKLLGHWTNDERAEQILEYFSSGEYAANIGSPSAVRKALVDAGKSPLLEMAKPFAELAENIVGAGSANLRDTGIPSLSKLADTMKKRLVAKGEDAGYIPAARLARTEFLNRYAAVIEGADEKTLGEALADLQGAKPAFGKAMVLADEVRGLLREMRQYLVDAKVDVGDLGPDYFPRVWDPHYLTGHQAEFMTMARKYPQWHDAKSSFDKLVASGGSEIQVVVDQPGFGPGNERKLAFVDDKDAAPFMLKDLHRIMDSYITQATRRAEWSRRLGDDNAGLNRLIEQARDEGASPRQITEAMRFVRGINGTLGDDINPKLRRVMGNAIVYQNIRLLPLAVFSMAVDPLGIIVNGGSAKQAWRTFMRGIREIPKGLRGDISLDAQTRFAQDVGTIDNAMLQHALGTTYTQGVTGDFARKVNDAFFRFNLVEQMNISMRVGATEAARLWMAEQVRRPTQHTERRLAEVGLTAADLSLDAQGDIVLTDKVRAGINQWVDGAVLRPDAADKPVWMNDPHWMLIAHLKQFVYSFHHTILARIVHEAKHGNYTPAMVMSSYVPVMIAADAVKALVQGGGDVPEWKRGWTAGDYLGSAVQRAGLLGVGQFGLEAAQGQIGALTGPTIEQLGDVAAGIGGFKQFDRVALRSLPANALYSGMLGGEPSGLGDVRTH